jgi:hypothetical protein
MRIPPYGKTGDFSCAGGPWYPELPPNIPEPGPVGCPNPPSHCTVFREWHDAHNVWRFDSSCVPPRDSGTMWSTTSPGTGRPRWVPNGSAQSG